MPLRKMSLRKRVRAVQVQFKTGLSRQHYTYITFLRLLRGDEVIVDTPGGGFVVAIVMGHDDRFWISNPHACKWIVQKIDPREYNRVRAIPLHKLIGK